MEEFKETIEPFKESIDFKIGINDEDNSITAKWFTPHKEVPEAVVQQRVMEELKFLLNPKGYTRIPEPHIVKLFTNGTIDW